MYKFSILISFIALCMGSAWAQTGGIQGKVFTSDQNPAEFVTISIGGTAKGAVVDGNGHYELKQIKPGTYTLRASFIGLSTQSKQVVVSANAITHVDFVMAENSEELKEVVVTANPSKYVSDYPSITLRLKTPLLEVPQNIQVVSRQELQDQQIFDMLEGVTRNVSGTTRDDHWDNYARISMRGSQVAGFRNGMNMQSSWGPLAEDMSMVERIEFVKGPAGFMLANGEPSGFYNVVTKKPTGISKGEVGMTVGSFDTYRTTVDLDGKVDQSERVLFRLNLMGQMKGSHRDYEYNNRLSVAPVLKFKLSPSTSLTAEYTYQNSVMSVIGSNYSYSSREMGELPAGFTTAEPNMEPTRINDHSMFLTLVHAFNANWKFTGQVAYSNFNQEGQSLWPSGFSDNGDTLRRAASIWDVLGIMKVGQFFVNGDFQTGFLKHRVLAGLDMGDKTFYHDWAQQGAIVGSEGFNVYNPVYGKVPASGFPQFDRTLDIRERGVYYSNKYAAFYVQDELRLFDDRLRLTIAGRYTTAKNYDPYASYSDAKKITPRAGASFSITPSSTVYGVYDQAFVPQEGADFNGKSFDPITGENLEVGFKKEWFNGLWTASVAAYQITKNNVKTADPYHQYFSIQLGQTRTRGIEFDIRGQLAQGLDVTMNYAFTDGKITKDTESDWQGQQIPGTSKHIANAWVNYRVQKGFADGLGLSLGMQYQGDRTNWYGVYTHTSPAMPDYVRFDGAISYQVNKFNVALNVNNLLGKYLYSGAYYAWGGFYYWQTEPLRHYRLSVSYRF